MFGNGSLGIRQTAYHHRIRIPQPRPRLAQAAVGHQIQILPTNIRRRENHNLQITLQGIVLHTVVGDNQLQPWISRQQRPARFDTFAAYRHRHTGLSIQHQRLVTRFGGRAASVQHMNLTALAPITPADDADLNSSLPQAVHQSGGNRGFADAADVDITHHHHRHR